MTASYMYIVGVVRVVVLVVVRVVVLVTVILIEKYQLFDNHN